MIQAWTPRRNRSRTIGLFLLCGLLVLAASLVGISDNPPGVALAFLAAAAFVVAFVHPWRSPKPFLHLLWITAATFLVSVVLHNLFEVGATRLGDGVALPGLLNGIGVIFFVVAVLVCPPALVVGIVGTIVTTLRRRPD